MSVTEQQVRAFLDSDEPDYKAAAQKLGPDALDVLEKLIRDPDPMLASKAAYLASMIPHKEAARVVAVGAQSSEVRVRLAAAAGLKNMQVEAENVIIPLLKDHDEGVRKVAVKSMRGNMTPAVRQLLEESVKRESNPASRAALSASLETAGGTENDGGEGHGGGSTDASASIQGRPSDAHGEGGGQIDPDAMQSSSGIDPERGGGDLGRGAAAQANLDLHPLSGGGSILSGDRDKSVISSHGGGHF